jgi:hypothetical protein
MSVFVGVEWITGMMLGIEFRSGAIIFDLLIVRIYVGVVDEQ